eukprot:CAMPEP_0182473754 /NCGR_PEP_ID=MMETSP1319-20130603/24510_1 /TAXON_ID=172717 /ORGANISM="Bolidomonas pacifica, Strain RCC208" /LENGTH=107 /DNA_ID=CAMNT_0024674587 /DNA_START=74 /DNA_END=397 /DNA_ORIENTATION=-
MYVSGLSTTLRVDRTSFFDTVRNVVFIAGLKLYLLSSSLSTFSLRALVLISLVSASPRLISLADLTGRSALFLKMLGWKVQSSGRLCARLAILLNMFSRFVSFLSTL